MTKSYLKQGQNLWAGIENENHTPGIQNHKSKKDQQPRSWHGYGDDAAALQDCMDNGPMGENATPLPGSTDNGFAGDDAATLSDCVDNGITG